MTWSPADMQHREPHVAIKTVRKFSALIRWVLLVVLAGLAIAALIALAVSVLFTAIENGL
jgi:high-affinity Fe2+/Pb2+ permease